MLCNSFLAALALLSPALAAPSSIEQPKFTADYRYDKHETCYNNLPKRSQLPYVPGHLNGSAWLWGSEDGLGRLNFLTPERIYQSMQEVKTGEIVPLNLPLELVNPPLFARPAFNHTFTKFGDGTLPVLDEEYDLNTQTSTQWDGFHHFAHLATGIFYNGCTTDVNLTSNHKCGIQEWASHGVAGRAILLDFASWAEKTGIADGMDPFEATNITFAQLEAVAKYQGIDLHGDVRIGDILMVRSGFIKKYSTLTAQEKKALAARPNLAGPNSHQRFIGVEQSKEMTDWLHDSYFSLVAGDQPAFESWPPQGSLSLHESILSLWGVGLGEFFDLEKLAEKCAKRKKWTFFVTSAPFNVDRGIATWANAIAIL